MFALTNGVFYGDLHALLFLVGDRWHLDGGVDDVGDAQVAKDARRQGPSRR